MTLFLLFLCLTLYSDHIVDCPWLRAEGKAHFLFYKSHFLSPPIFLSRPFPPSLTKVNLYN